jgi:hypothetical protein
MSETQNPPAQAARPKRHPFRPSAVAHYERPLSGYVPELKPHRPWWLLAAGAGLLIGMILWN